MSFYPPEGLYPLLLPNSDTLRRAAGKADIFQAMCIKCDEFHNLHVDLGTIRGIIPREEAAMGIAEGTTKEIAILSRVGKPVAFQILGFTSDGHVLLSRRAAQEAAADWLLSCLRPGDILPAVVQSLAAFGAFCDIGCGFTALMGIDRCSVSRIAHTNQRFSPGQRIYAIVLSIEGGRVNLSHRELLGTWAENAAHFRPGQTVTGMVRSVQPYGVFIELSPNLSGLGEVSPDLSPGDTVSVFIRSINPERQKIKLAVLEKLPPLKSPFPLRYYRTTGHMSRWEYAPGNSTLTLFGS